jgi:exodeoxyribonuclease-3
VPVIWLGDLNVAPLPIDVYDSTEVWPDVCHGPEVIAAFTAACQWGLEDVFRKHLPGPGNYTFWDYRVPAALKRGIGWRIDHILATPALAARSTHCEVDLDSRRADSPSDHAIVWAEFTT